MRDRDIIGDVLTRAMDAARKHLSARNIAAEAIDEVCGQIAQVEPPARVHWGGATLYIPKTPDTGENRRLAVEEAMRTGRIPDAAARYGVPRATMYRLVRAASDRQRGALR